MVDAFMSSSTGFSKLQAVVVLLASVQSELDHVLTDPDEVLRSHVKRAFLHLQRSLIADESLRGKWLNAFKKGETDCEQLGAVHLLLHGVWAFKVSNKGERTDLVLGTHLVIDPDFAAATHGLVLTEWKLVRGGDSPDKKADEAKSQAARYSESGLAGFVLENERYLVLVAESEFAAPRDIRDGATLYKVIPVFLTRQSPSVSAKKGI